MFIIPQDLTGILCLCLKLISQYSPPILFPSEFLKKVSQGEEKEQTKVYDHVQKGSHVVKKTDIYQIAYIN